MQFPSQDWIPFTESGVKGINVGQAGCYGIFNANRFIYIGKADDIVVRVLQHVTGQSDQARCIWSYSPTHWVGVVLTGDLIAQERLLIAQYKPVCNLA